MENGKGKEKYHKFPLFALVRAHCFTIATIISQRDDSVFVEVKGKIVNENGENAREEKNKCGDG